MASSNNSLELSINPGLNLNMRVQNSISFKAPSPSKSPSLSIHISSSSLMPCNPNKAEFLFKLWNVITPFSSSINNRNPLPSSFIKPSAPNFSTMAGKKSSNTTPFLDPIDDQASIHVKKSKTLFCVQYVFDCLKLGLYGKVTGWGFNIYTWGDQWKNSRRRSKKN